MDPWEQSTWYQTEVVVAAVGDAWVRNQIQMDQNSVAQGLKAAAAAETALAAAGFVGVVAAAVGVEGKKGDQMDCPPDPKRRDSIACHSGPMPRPLSPPLTLLTTVVVVVVQSRHQSLPTTIAAVVAAAVVAMVLDHQKAFPEKVAVVAPPRTSFPNAMEEEAVADHTSSAVAAVAASYQGYS